MTISPMILLLLGVAGAHAQEYCSLVVRVVNSGGGPLSGVPVIVEEKDGRTLRRAAERGEARFCDLGLGVLHVTVSVGSQYDCNYATVQNVPLVWGFTRNLTVTFDGSACVADAPPPVRLCAILYRFVDEGGNWVSGVVLEPPLSALPDLRSDTYGRMMVTLARNEELHTKAGKPGYAPAPIDLSCSRDLTDKERRVVLRRTSAR